MLKQLEPTSRNPVTSPVSVMARIHACESCGARARGLCSTLPPEETERVAMMRTTQRSLPGESLFDEGEAAQHLFTIVDGWVKIFKLMPDGRRQITGFLTAGDMLGLSFNEQHSYSAEALTEVVLCRFPRQQFEQLLDRHPKMERRLLAIASHELAAAQDQMMLLGRKTAPERIASFLLAMTERMEKAGVSGERLHLTMTRADIADYLGLTTETVSRVFTSLRQRGLIELDGAAFVRIREADELQDLACGAEAA